jgi:hypothetical protein
MIGSPTFSLVGHPAWGVLASELLEYRTRAEGHASGRLGSEATARGLGAPAQTAELRLVWPALPAVPFVPPPPGRSRERPRTPRR